MNNLMNKITLYFKIILICFLLTIPEKVLSKDAECRKNCNIIIITVDSLRYDRLGAYGCKSPVSPNIDKLAEEGLTFLNTYAQGNWTSPSLISLFSSLYPLHHGVDKRNRVLNTLHKTPVHIFNKSGFKTPGYVWQEDNYSNLGFTKPISKDPLISLEKLKNSRFFMWLHYRGPHLPYNPPKNVLKLFLNTTKKAASLQLNNLIPVQTKNILNKDLIKNINKKNDLPALLALYDAEIREQDRILGELFNKLKELNIYEKSIIILTTDHGEELLDHNGIGHASTWKNSLLYDELIHIPLIIRIPGSKYKSAKIDSFVEQVDILPTFLDYFNLNYNKDKFDGKSFKPLLTGEGSWCKNYVFAASTPCGWQCKEQEYKRYIYSLRTKQYKLILDKSPNNSKFYLFDIKKDPFENNNIYNNNIISLTLTEKLNNWILKTKTKNSLAPTLKYKKFN